jgi:UDP-GlcNAc3NAcA epimerase
MPEEINRIVADAVSEVLFAPTRVAVKNLEREGRLADAIVHTGDVMYDAAIMHGDAADERSRILTTLALTKGRYILATVHRAENTDDARNLRVILGALGQLSARHDVVLPIHPRTRLIIEADNQLRSLLCDARLIAPVGFLDMIALERGAALIITDSGGVQKEAFFQRVPCVTLRQETEWPELIELGWNKLSPLTSAESVLAIAEDSIGSVGREGAPYGSGDASSHIADALASRY